MKRFTQVVARMVTGFIFCIAALQASAQCGLFYDGFESGNWSPTWTAGTGSYNRTVMTGGAAVGNNFLRMECATTNSFYQGSSTVFTPGQPTYMSWWMRTNTTSGANGYVVVGNSNINTDNGIVFCYFNASSGLRFFASTGYNYPITANTWYHVECKNMNWTTRTLDIWVNGVQILTAWPFRSTTATNIDRIHLHSLVASAADYDDFQIGVPGVSIGSFSTTEPACAGDSTGGVDITSSTVNGSMTYLWSNGATTQDLSGVAAGSYAVTVTDSLGCTAIGTYAVTAPSVIAPATTPVGTTCPGGSDGSLTATASGGTPGYQFLWSTGDTTAMISGLSAGTYILTVQDSNGCVVTDTAAISEPAAFVDSAAITTPVCPVDTSAAIDYSLVGGSAPYTFIWSNGANMEDISGIGAGTYTVTATDIFGCTYVGTVQVVGPAAIDPNPTIVQPLCNGQGNGSITLAPLGGTPGYTYAWGVGGAGNGITVGAGAYSVTVTDANGCTQVDTIAVTEPAVVSATGFTTADDGTTNGAIDLTATGGTPGYSYAWSNGATTEDLGGIAAGTYTVTVTDANGCTVTASFVVDLVIGVRPAHAWTATVSPNPFVGQFAVELAGLGNASAALHLTDLRGRVVWESSEVHEGKVWVSQALAAGTYLLTIEVGAERWTQRVVRN